MIRLENISFSYPKGSFSLEFPSLQVEAGTHAALIGPSGSGKSTLLNLLSGILLPEKGTVHIYKEQINSKAEAARRAFRLQEIGMIFQSFALLQYLNVENNIMLPLILSGQTITKELKGRCRELLKSVGLEGMESRHPAQLSQGEQQRVAICRALINKPKIILADEPTGNLDHDNATSVLDLMLEQVRISGATLIMSTHDRSLFDKFDRVIDINELTRKSL